MTGLAFDEDSGTWTVETDGGSSYRSRTVVMASGPLANANFPDIRGLHSYAGHKIHSARWDHDYDMSDKRVAVIGTGASAVQIVPELVKTARSVKVFQRTPGWVLPRPDFPHPSVAKAAFGRLPILQSAARQAWFWAHEVMAVGMVWNTPATTAIAWAAKANLRRQVKDSWMRRQLTPDFRPGCKRMLMTSDYYPALRQNNCKLITWPIATISPIGIRTADGIEHEVDCIVFATGFDVCKAGTPFPITGVDGRKLAEEWSNGAYAYKSVSVSGYPNLFFHLRAEFRARTQLGLGLPGSGDPLHRRRHRHNHRRRYSDLRRQRGPAEQLSRPTPASACRHDVELRMQELVPHRRRL